MRHAYIATGGILASVALLTLLTQAFVWLWFGDWPPAPLSIIWRHIGIDGPGGDLSLTGVFGLLGGWFLWEGYRRQKTHRVELGAEDGPTE